MSGRSTADASPASSRLEHGADVLEPGDDDVDSIAPPAERTAARLMAHAMMEAVQWGPVPSPGFIADVVESGDLKGWF